MSRRLSFLSLIAAAFVLGIACNRKPPDIEQPVPEDDEVPGPALFEDITEKSAVRHSYANGQEAGHFAILESLGGGAAVFDYDGDGLYDVFLPGGGGFAGKDKKDIVGAACKLFRNLGGGKFEDVTAKVGLDKLAGGKAWFYTHGAAVADVDRDGWPDLLVTGWGGVALFRNVTDGKGGRRFEDVTAKAGLDKGITWGVSAAFADLDGDGWPDLYVAQYVDWSWAKHPTDCTYGGPRDVCPPRSFTGLRHKVFRNDGKGGFLDATAEAGLRDGGQEESKGLGVLSVDVNADGKPDIYVANDTTDNYLYINESVKGKLKFREAGLSAGVARDERGRPNGSMGVAAGDPRRKGRPDIWVTNYENELHALYGNECKGDTVFFNYLTSASGIGAIGQIYVGWGTAFVDVDLDGWEDLVISNGHAIMFPRGKGVGRKQQPMMLLNEKGRFRPASKRFGSYGDAPHLGRGVGFGDLDNDGRIDLVLNHCNEPTAVLRGVGGAGKHWLGVELVGKDGADVVGAKVTLRAGGETQTRFATGGGSYASASDPRRVFGLGDLAAVDGIEIVWPDGTKQEHKSPAIDRYHVAVQGEAKLSAYPRKR